MKVWGVQNHLFYSVLGAHPLNKGWWKCTPELKVVWAVREIIVLDLFLRCCLVGLKVKLRAITDLCCALYSLHPFFLEVREPELVAPVLDIQSRFRYGYSQSPYVLYVSQGSPIPT